METLIKENSTTTVRIGVAALEKAKILAAFNDQTVLEYLSRLIDDRYTIAAPFLNPKLKQDVELRKELV